MSNNPTAPFKFTPEDFEGLHQVFSPDVTAAILANGKLQDEMSKWVKVYGFNNSRIWKTDRSSYGKNNGIELIPETHFSYLTPPQLIEVEECKHEPIVVVKIAGYKLENCTHFRQKVEEFTCSKCGVELTATYTAKTSNPVKKDGAR